MISLGLVSKYTRPYVGFLHKKGHLFTSWKLREFTVEGNTLTYRDKGVVKGSYSIDSSSILKKSEDMEGFTNCFTLITTKGTLIMSAATVEERENWMGLIYELISGGPAVTIADVLPGGFYLKVPLSVTFPSGVVASNGNVITPFLVSSPPTISFKPLSESLEKLYTLVMIDPDAPSKTDPIYREFVHWVVVNMPGCDVTAGETVAPYVGAAPPFNSSLHRYFFFLYEQPSPFSATEVRNLADYFVQRGGFTLMRWADKVGLAYPVGVEGFQAEWDEYVDELHKAINFMPPAQYRSPKQQEEMKLIEPEADNTSSRNVNQVESNQLCAKCWQTLKCAELFDFNVSPTESVSLDKLCISNSDHYETHLPPVVLGISYLNVSGKRKNVLRGNTLSPAETVNVPEVFCAKDYLAQDRYYALVMTDPDAPSPENRIYGEFVHWVVVNIPGSIPFAYGGSVDMCKSGETLLNYLGCGPPHDSGLHRYLFFLFDQGARLSSDAVAQTKEYFAPRAKLSVGKWAKNMGFLDVTRSGQRNPVGVNGFLAEWDESVDGLHASIGFTPPEEYRSPLQGGNKNRRTSKIETVVEISGNNEVDTVIKELLTAHPFVFSGDWVSRRLDDGKTEKVWAWCNAANRTFHWSATSSPADESKFFQLINTSKQGGSTTIKSTVAVLGARKFAFKLELVNAHENEESAEVLSRLVIELPSLDQARIYKKVVDKLIL